MWGFLVDVMFLTGQKAKWRLNGLCSSQRRDSQAGGALAKAVHAALSKDVLL